MRKAGVIGAEKITGTALLVRKGGVIGAETIQILFTDKPMYYNSLQRYFNRAKKEVES